MGPSVGDRGHAPAQTAVPSYPRARAIRGDEEPSATQRYSEADSDHATS